MGIHEIGRFAVFALAFLSSVLVGSESHESNRIRYLMQKGKLHDCLNLYQSHFLKGEKHDLSLIQEMAISLLQEGYALSDDEMQIMAIFGAGISMDDKALGILEEGLSNRNPMVQLVALNYLAKYQNDDADAAINQALSSNFLPIRLEAVYHLAEKNYPTTVGQLESLMYKIDPALLPIFPELFAMVGDPSSIQNLRRLMIHPLEAVRVEAISSAARHGRDDLLPEIRKLASHHQAAQQEACAIALGTFKDQHSKEILQTMAQSSTASVRIAALLALYKIGHADVAREIEEIARNGDLFAIAALGEISGSEDLLSTMMSSPSLTIRVNATLSLLEHRDPRCIPGLVDILIRDSRDLAFVKTQTIGKGLSAWKVTPSAMHNLKNPQVGLEVSLKMREATLIQILEMDENLFFEVADVIFRSRQRELVPTTVFLIENLATPKSIELLKKHQQLVGAPLIRNYCNLALYRLKEEGPYLDNLKQWVHQQQMHEMIRFRPLVPREMNDENSSPYRLTPEDTSRLLVESYETLAQSQSDDAINILLNAIQYGNPKNRYALAGLLMRAAQ